MIQAKRATRTDGERTRARILECAGLRFAALGYAEATSKSIAEAAGVDLASINYHFGSRGGLYQAVLAEAHRRLVSLEQLQRLMASGLPPRDKLGRLVDNFAKGLAARRSWHIRVLAREVMAPTSHLRVLYQRELAPKLAVVAALLSEVTAIPADDPSLLPCVLSVVAPFLMLSVAASGVPGPARELLRMPRDVLAAHLRRFALAGLEAAGREYANRGH